MAVIGAGLSGLTCAQRLGAKSYKVTVFEAGEAVGGRLREIMDQSLMEEELKRQFAHAPYELVSGKKIDSLDGMDFDAIYIATGKGGEDFGLLSGWHSDSMATDRPGTFMGGEITGQSLMDGISHGKIAAVSIEKYVQVGSMDGQSTSFHQSEYLLPEIEDTPVGQPPEGEIYTKEEAVAEVGRCLHCNCDICMEQCAFMKATGFAGKDLDARCVKAVGAMELSVHTGIRDILSCDLCGHCSAVCPHGIDIAGMMFKYKQDVNRIKKIAPYIYDYYRRDMDLAMGEDHLLQLPEEGKADYLLFPGCSVVQNMPEHVMILMEQMKSHGLKSGLLLSCCGVPAAYAGEKDRIETARQQIREDWETAGKPTVVTVCVSCHKYLAETLPEIPLISVYELMRDWNLESAPASEQAAVFDPCAGTDYPMIGKSVRDLLHRAGADISELEEGRGKPRCCGFGGHVYAANPEIAKLSTKMAAELSGSPYIVYCENCRRAFIGMGKQCRHALDILLGTRSREINLHLSEMALNRRKLKTYFTKGEMPEVQPAGGSIFPEEVLTKMDSLFISEEEVLSVLQKAKEEGQSFFDEGTGLHYASAQEGVMTCWVSWRDAEDGIHIENVYKHKMGILGEAV